MSRELIVFDCDGVLVDSEILVVELEAELLTAAGFPVTAAEVLERFVGLSYPSMMAALEAEHGRRVPDELSATIQQAALDQFPYRLRPVAGMPQLLDLLAGSSLARCVASSSNLDRIELSLEICGLSGYFEPGRLFSAQMVANGKPAPDLFLLAASTLGAEPGDCLVIEDSAPGVTAALAAGMSVVGLAAGGHAGPGLAERLLAAGASHVFSDSTALAEHLGCS